MDPLSAPARPQKPIPAVALLELLPLMAVPLFVLSFASAEGFAWVGLPVAFSAGLGWWRAGRRGWAITYFVLRGLTMLALGVITVQVFAHYFVICDNRFCYDEYRTRNLIVLIAAYAPLLLTYALSCVISAILVAHASERSQRSESGARRGSGR
jgi:hypothetical protein